MLAIFEEPYICAAHQGPTPHHLHGNIDSLMPLTQDENAAGFGM